MPDETEMSAAYEAGDVQLKLVGPAQGGLSPERARQYLAKTVRPARVQVDRETIDTEEVPSA